MQTDANIHLRINPCLLFLCRFPVVMEIGESKGMNKILILHNFNLLCDVYFLRVDFSVFFFIVVCFPQLSCHVL